MHPGIHAAVTPDKPAYVMGGSGEVVTYAALEARSNQYAQLFRALGLRTGDGIAFVLENHPRFYELVWGAQRAGLYYTPISHRLTAGEIAYILGDCDAKLFIASAAHAEAAAAALAEAPPIPHRFMLDGDAPGFESLGAAIAAQPTEPIADESEGSDMLYSSGTTGRPKGVKFPLAGLALGQQPPLVRLMQILYGVDESTVYLSPAPLYHAAPLRFSLAVQRLGGTCVIMEKFDPEAFLRLVAAHRVTHTQVVPTMFIRMLNLPDEVRAAADVSSLQAAIHAAAPCPIPVKEQMIAWWGPVIYEYYAGTEGNGFCAITAEEWLTHKGSVGRPLAGEVHIVDDDGTELPPGEAGTIYFGGSAEFEYHTDAEKTAASRDPRGWSTLGDVGYLDDDGYLYLTDRKANMIISGGVNIYPQEAENLLVTHPKVADVAVFGIPNDEFGEEVKAVVQPVDMAAAGPALAAELIEFCRANLSSIKCPRSIDFEAELPRHPTGKLFKRLLKDRYWAGHRTRIL
jgi:long-chain acyl-CoA synthetase